MSAAPELSVVIPTYNERDNIQRLVPQLDAALRGTAYEVVVVDDRSPDGTGEAVIRLQAAGYPVRLVTKDAKQGIGAALRVGYTESLGAIISSMDADLSFDPADLRRLTAGILAGADLALGRRHGMGGGYETPNIRVWIKRVISGAGNAVIRLITGIPVRDFTANFRAFKRELWEAIGTKEKTNILLFEMILLSYVQGFMIAEVPVTFRDRRSGTSKLRLSKEAPKFLVKLVSYRLRFNRELRSRRRERSRSAPSAPVNAPSGTHQ